MSVESLATVLHHSKAKGTTKLVLLGIANHDGDGGAWPTVARLCRYANAKRRTVQDAISALTEAGELKVYPQAGGTADDTRHWSQRPNRYAVLLECPDGCAGGIGHKPRRGWTVTATGEYVPVDNTEGDRVRETAPGAGDRTRGGAGDRTLTTTETTHDTPGSASVTTGSTAGLCSVCGNAYERCQSVQSAWPQEDRHTFAPQRLGADRDRARDQRADDSSSYAAEED